MKQFKRSYRLAEQILRTISTSMDGELSDLGYGMVTFTSVRLTDKLRQALVYYSFLGDEDSRQRLDNYLVSRRGKIRSLVGRQLCIRHIPEFEFRFDPSVEEGMRIEELLNDIKSSKSDPDPE